MAIKKSEAIKISPNSTKNEMLDAYNALLKQIDERKQTQLKPEIIAEERKSQASVQTADALSAEGVGKEINELKLEITRMLGNLSYKLEQQVARYRDVQKAIELKELELKEIYEIEKSAGSLAALIEAQSRRSLEFDEDMARKKAALEDEIRTKHEEWEKERKQTEGQIKEWEAGEVKRREREKTEFTYAFQREQQLARDKFADETTNLEKAIQIKKETFEKDYAERSRALKAAEQELNELRTRAGRFQTEMETMVTKAVKETTEKLQTAAKNAADLTKKEFEGERNVLNARLETLQETVKQQAEQIAKLNKQTEMAYDKVQHIAMKAIDGSANLQSAATLQRLISEPIGKMSGKQSKDDN